jgi:hypothetical protein
MVGLGVMGENLALNIESHGFSVVGFDLDPKKVDNFASRTLGKKVVAVRTMAEFVDNLEVPRRILMMVPAGKPVDAVIADLRPRLAAGDILMDGGNTLFVDTDRRIKELQGTGDLLHRHGRQRWRRRRLARSRHHARWKFRGMAVGQADLAGHRCQGRGRCALLRVDRQRRRRPFREDGSQRHRVRRHADDL